jgi:hypothetical protein
MPKNYLNLLLFVFLFQTTAYSNDRVVIKDTLQNQKKTKKSILKSDPNKTISITKSEFTPLFLKENYPIAQVTNADLKTAKDVIHKIDSLQAFIKNLEPTSLSSLPIGINKTIGTISYTLGISNAKFTPEYTEFTAFVRIIIPQGDENGKMKELFFGANNIKLSHKGGLVGDTNLVLLGDFPIKINGDNSLLVLKGGMDMKTGDITNKTYVTIDCSGFKQLGITADVEFSRSIIEPVGANNKALPSPKRVTGSFSTTVSNWNDILINISLPKFQLTSFKDTFFEVNTAVIDLSDIRNSTNVVWPKDYQKDYLVPGNENIWRGLYVNSLKVTLPEQFKKKGSTQRISFQATNLLLDRQGVSGTFAVDNILPITEGTASGWQFSVNHLGLGFVANKLVSGEFAGGIVLPITNKAKAGSTEKVGLDYKATINPVDNIYTLIASPTSQIGFDLFKAKAKIEKDSYVLLTVKDGDFLPVANLNGSLTIRGNNSPPEATPTPEDPGKKEPINFQGITFQNLRLQTVKPYISATEFGYKNYDETDTKSSNVSNFPITIQEITLKADETSASIKIGIAVNLMKGQFNGQTKFEVVGKFDEGEGLQSWKFHHLKFEEISLSADIGGAKFSGSLIIRDNDPVYGDGFKGTLKAEFKGGIMVEATAIFGKKDAFRYWYVDAMVGGLNIPFGAFVFKGFGGGAYYNMKKAGFSSRMTGSGVEYVPDEASGLGIKAMIQFANAASPDAFWGGAGFEIAFLKTGGISRISIYGEGHVMQDFGFKDPTSSLKGNLQKIVEKEAALAGPVFDKLKESNLTDVAKQAYPDGVSGKAGLNAFAAIEYDFTKKTLHGSFDLYIDVVGGLIKGRASGNRAGWAVLHFAPNSFYIRMGTPTDRLGIKLGLGSFNLEAGGYFMIGDDIPASPGPPAIVASILRLPASELDYMRSENSSTLGSGKGFAFGADFSLNTGDMKFLIFYASFQAGFGFDIMVKDYGEAQCKGSGQIGMNGWYANGQSYAYLQGELGIEVNLFFIHKKVSIIKGGGAVVLQAKLPNPAWIRGYMGGYFEILGGLVKGSFRFKLEFGEQCEFVNANPLGGLKCISDINPTDGGKDISVFAIPQVGFNMPVDRLFRIEGEDGARAYRIKLEEYSIKKDGVPVIGQVSWNTTNDLATFNASEVLPQNSNLTLKATVSFQEWVNGAWNTIYQNGQIATETEVRNFATGKAPDFIPANNISYTYPVFDQKYVYQNESKQAYVVLKQGQTYLFELKPGQSQKAFYTNDKTTAAGNLTYDSANKRVNIDLPVLSTKSPYKMTLMTLNPSSDASNNLAQNYDKKELDANASVETKSTKLKETLESGDGIEMLKYNFNTSQYNTFQEKITAKTPKQTLVEIIYMDVHALQSSNNSTEPFDDAELIGNEKTMNKPLVTTEAILDDTYYLNEVKPLIYAGYPMETVLKLDRDNGTDKLGIPPTKGVEVMAWYQDYLINNPNSFMLKDYLPYRYNLPFYYKQDFINLRYKVTDKFVNTINQAMIAKYDYIIHGNFPYLKKGLYKFRLNYILPGGQAGTSSIFTFNKSN